jgi:hypothetical protein
MTPLRESQDKLEHSLPGPKFYRAVMKVIYAYHLTERYWSAIREYILTGKFPEKFEVDRRKPKIWSEPIPFCPGKSRVFMEIFSETTQEDIKKNWEEIAIHFGAERKKPEKRERSSLPHTFRRDLAMHKLRKKGYKLQEISEIICRETEEVVYACNIAAIVKRFEKKIIDA